MSSDDDDDHSADIGDDDVALPRATVFKLIKEMLPKDLRCANDTRELVLDCCTEFVHLIASEANEVCEKDGKKTIGAEHVLTALKNLDFESYIEEARTIFEEHREEKKKRVKLGKKIQKSGIPPEELAAQQRALFQQARMRSNSVQGPPPSATAPAQPATLEPTSSASNIIPPRGPSPLFRPFDESSDAIRPEPLATVTTTTATLAKPHYTEDDDYD